MTDTWKPEDHIPESIAQLLNRAQPNYVLTFLHILELLKTQRRTGWVDFGINPCESISDHCYRMGITTMLIKDPQVNKDACVRIALVHDMAEALVGDITPFDKVGKEEKHRREWETIQYICEKLIRPYNPAAADQIVKDWLSYENCDSLEARYVKDIDKFEMLVQCFEYEKRTKGAVDLGQFWSACDMVKTDEVRSWVQDLLVDRENFFKTLSK